MTTLVVAVADTQSNYHVGLCPPEVKLDKGGTYSPSGPQLKVWEKWIEFWSEMQTLKKTHKARCFVVLVGDLADKNKHDGLGLISANDVDIVKLAAQSLAPALEVADVTFVVRGTEAHSGGHAYLEEFLAKDIGAEGDAETGAASWWWLPLEADGVSFDFSHHPGTSGRVAWTRQAAADREALSVSIRYWERNLRLRDVVVRAHLHYFAESSPNIKPHTLFCPSWQYITVHDRRYGADGFAEPVGGLWFLCKDGAYTYDVIRYWPSRRGSWTKENSESARVKSTKRGEGLLASMKARMTRKPKASQT